MGRKPIICYELLTQRGNPSGLFVLGPETEERDLPVCAAILRARVFRDSMGVKPRDEFCGSEDVRVAPLAYM